MPVTDDGVEILPVHECWDLLRGLTLGRLVTHADGQPDIFPVNYVVQRRTVLFRTAEGTKLISAAINNRVLFEVDDHNVAGAWTVIIRGIARSLRTTEEIEEAERAGAAVDQVGEDALCTHRSRERHRPPLPVRVTGGLISRPTRRSRRGRGAGSPATGPR